MQNDQYTYLGGKNVRNEAGPMNRYPMKSPIKPTIIIDR